MEEKTEGLLLQSISYLGSQKILKVFAPDAGLVTLMSKKPALASATDPFLLAEWVYRKGKEEIHLLKDATILDDFGALRQNFATLAAAGSIARDLLRTQLPAKKGGGLYALALAYLNHLPRFSSPETLAESFRLKLLLHEGLLSLERECTHCGAPASRLFEGESVCSRHAPAPCSTFTAEEWEILQTLAHARKFALLQSAVAPTGLQGKIELLFDERMKH